MTKPVYVLGAGFSVDFSPTQFPVSSTFLRTAKRWNIYKPKDTHGELGKFIVKYFGDEDTADVERILSFLASEAYSQLEDDELRLRLYDNLVMIIVNTLTSASATVAGRFSVAPSQRGKPWQNYEWTVYRRFADLLVSRGATVITFNYDLLLEFLLRSTGSWSMADGYGIDIPLINELLPREHSRPIAALSETSACTLLKLHGSINWGGRIDPQKGRSAADVQQQLLEADRLYRLPDDLSHGILNFQTIADPKLSSPIYLRPTIIPPIVDKSAWRRNRALGSLWKKAADALRECDEVTIVGYSLPPSDFLAEFLFRESSRDSKMSVVNLISPDAKKIANRIAEIFGCPTNAIDTTFLEWLPSLSS